MTLLLAKVDNIEQKALEDLESQDGAAYSGDGFILDRFLNECRSDAQTVLDNIDYQQDQVFEEVSPQVPAKVPEMVPELKPEPTMSASTPTIRLMNTLGHTYTIPLEHCKTREVRAPLAPRCCFPTLTRYKALSRDHHALVPT